MSKKNDRWLTGAQNKPDHICLWCGSDNWIKWESAWVCNDCHPPHIFETWEKRHARILKLREGRNCEYLNYLPSLAIVSSANRVIVDVSVFMPKTDAENDIIPEQHEDGLVQYDNRDTFNEKLTRSYEGGTGTVLPLYDDSGKLDKGESQKTGEWTNCQDNNAKHINSRSVMLNLKQLLLLKKQLHLSTMEENQETRTGL